MEKQARKMEGQAIKKEMQACKLAKRGADQFG
jgi:hypothetical protein